MIIDAHVSVDPDRYPAPRAIEVLGAANIESAVIFADARSEDLREGNRYVLDVARAFDLYPFYYLGGNPFTDTRPDRLELPDNIDEYAGIRWHRWIAEGIDRSGQLDRSELEWAISLMESPEFEAITSAAAHYDLPIIFEESYAVTLEFVDHYPSLDIIIPHLGSGSGGEANTVRALWDVPNVYFDTSLVAVDEGVLSSVGPQRILFGSGYPYGDPEAELSKIDRLPVSEDVKEAIYGDNLESLLSGHRDDDE
jgi:hypothetical protein